MNKSSLDSEESRHRALEARSIFGDLSFLLVEMNLRCNLGDRLGDLAGEKACLGDFRGDADSRGDLLGVGGEKQAGLIEQALVAKSSSMSSISVDVIFGISPT